MKKYLFIVFLFINFFAYANYKVLKSYFNLDVYHIGDKVIYYAQIETNTPIVEKVKIPKISWGTINEIKIKLEKANIYSIKMTLTPYDVGSLVIPKINLGSFELENISIFVDSLLKGKNKKIEGIRPPLLLPGTKILVASIVSFILFISIFVVLFLRYWKDGFLNTFENIKFRSKKRKFFKKINNYKHNLENDARSLYADLLLFVRAFFSIFLEIDTSSFTVSELKIKVKDSFGDDSVYKDLNDLLEKINNVSFSNQKISINDFNSDFSFLKNVLIELSKAINKRKNEESLNAL